MGSGTGVPQPSVRKGSLGGKGTRAWLGRQGHRDRSAVRRDRTRVRRRRAGGGSKSRRRGVRERIGRHRDRSTICCDRARGLRKRDGDCRKPRRRGTRAAAGWRNPRVGAVGIIPRKARRVAGVVAIGSVRWG